ncbi:MAG: ABC transporter ATP-binding protein [Lentisphaerae bacterium]|nr:ABC transporter ATP-binding protein [Lentisphaerota bacterium]
MSRKKEKYTKPLPISIYWRLLKYVKPYKWRLMIGILAGLVASGSMFGGIMVLPQLVKGVNVVSPETMEQNRRTAVKIIRKLDEVPKQNYEARENAVEAVLNEPSGRGVLEHNIDKTEKKLQKFLPASWNIHVVYDQGTVVLQMFGKNVIGIPAETRTGKMTWQFFALFAFFFVVLWAIRNLFIFINHYYMRWVGIRVVTDLRLAAFRTLMDQSLSFFGRIDIGQMISRTTNDTTVMETAVANSIADATRCPMEIATCVIAVCIASSRFNNWMLPLILMLGLPLCMVPLVLISRRIRNIFRRAFEQIAVVVQRMHEVLSGIVVVKAYHAEDREIEKFGQVNRKYFKTLVKALKSQLFMQPLMETVAVTATLVFLVYSYSQEVTLGDLVQLLAPIFLAYQPIKQLAKVFSNVQRSMAAADRYFELLDMHTSLVEKPDAFELSAFNDRIQLENVTFSYGDRTILDGISLTIPKGHMVAVVGSTGSGKTTIANLIARFYDVNSGRVLIDGHDVRDISVDSLRRQIGIVSQTPILFNDTIANNIAYGVPDAPREAIIEAAKLVNAHEFITDGRHPEGYDTVVGEKGFKLSGGEQQRVTIARAVLRNPSILILDEATSALDTATERQVQEALARAMKNRTVFAIAHRLSTIKNANLIIVLDHGHIIESGTHEELLAKGGKYRELYDTQFSKDI